MGTQRGRVPVATGRRMRESRCRPSAWPGSSIPRMAVLAADEFAAVPTGPPERGELAGEER
jgi:hypothetical protein